MKHAGRGNTSVRKQQTTNVVTVGLGATALSKLLQWASSRSVRVVSLEDFPNHDAATAPCSLLLVGSRARFAESSLQGFRVRHPGLQVLVVIEAELTQEDHSSVITNAFNSGVDDVTRATDVAEFEARLNRGIHRASGMFGKVLQIGPLLLHADSGLAMVEDSSVVFRPAEIATLSYLFMRRGYVVSSKELRREALRTVADDHTVRNHIYEIRRKLASLSPGLDRLVATVRGEGYSIQWSEFH